MTKNLPARHQNLYPSVLRPVKSFIKCEFCSGVVSQRKPCCGKQQLLTKNHKSTIERSEAVELNQDESLPLGKKLCEMFLKANIPLKKLSHPAVRDFLQTNLRNNEPLPSESTIRQKFVPELYDEKMDELRKRAEGKCIWACIDETTDDEQRHVVNFVFGLLEGEESNETGKAYLFNMATVEAVNTQTMAQFFNDSVAMLWPKGGSYFYFIAESNIFYIFSLLICRHTIRKNSACIDGRSAIHDRGNEFDKGALPENAALDVLFSWPP